MTSEQLKKAIDLTNSIGKLKEHLKSGFGEGYDLRGLQFIENTKYSAITLLNRFLPCDLESFRNLYRQNVQAEIIKLEDELKNL